ncbi:hypothetical protein CEXT_225801 [Caerostris extrusa]|uniref:Uncharacterized protein n=1 Tax=Caerostris extrusa TaxID=172846 RepID=A0AAV4PXG4_CAEEX|nr:hypothetical protein CEXT_225801 [Caerostris extrusa]
MVRSTRNRVKVIRGHIKLATNTSKPLSRGQRQNDHLLANRGTNNPAIKASDSRKRYYHRHQQRSSRNKSIELQLLTNKRALN